MLSISKDTFRDWCAPCNCHRKFYRVGAGELVKDGLRKAITYYACDECATVKAVLDIRIRPENV